MTIIAYRDGILAADTLSTCYGTRAANVTKIARVNNWLLGGSGRLGVLTPMAAWAKKANLDVPIDFGKIEDSGGILVSPKGQLYYTHSGCGYVIPNEAPFAAMGSGSEIALGAMFMKATSLEAVEAAKSLETSCGGSTVWLSVDGRGNLELKKEIYSLND